MSRYGLFVLLVACSSAPTEVVVRVSTDLDVPGELDQVVFRVTRDGNDTERIAPVTNASDFPLTLGLTYTDGPLGPVDVRVIGMLDDDEVVQRAARFDFVRGSSLLLEVALERACIGMECPEQTCAAGVCREVYVSPEELVPWFTPDAGGCSRETCNGRDDDCDGETDEDWTFATDMDHCGGCGRTCRPGRGATLASCDSGLCHQTCESGLGDCDADAGNGCEADLSSTNAHCGGCGQSCTRFQADTRCNAGRCELLACEPGFRDCDLNPDSGCESELSDTTNCGGCGLPCDLLHATEACGMGTCRLSSCDDDWDNCDGRIENGCEAAVDSDVFHCGACGRRCEEDAPNSSDTCEEGMCGVECHPGWRDCDAVAPNGCETDLSDPSHCGACDTRCSGVAFLCSGTPAAGFGCIPPPCMDPPTRCGATCVDTETNPAHCGGCDVACPGGPNAAPVCVSSGCGLHCDPGFGDCDDDPVNGCETSLNDATHCGACGRACMLPSAVSACIGATCSIASCAPGTSDCNLEPADGCETAITTATNCGACGVACTRAHASVTCGTGTCRIAVCSPGWGDCDGVDANGCETPLVGCETCTGTCVLDHAVAECVADACRILDCDPTWDDCDGVVGNGCETSLDSPADCGGCDVTCDPMHATGTCPAGTCAVASCDPGWGDCDLDPSTGCEADLFDEAHCGTCARTCAGAEVCIEGSCRTGFVQVTAAHLHSCGIDVSGQAYCWGEGGDGRLGHGMFEFSLEPVAVVGLDDAVDISAGNTSTCAVRATGRVLCWGQNASGVIGVPGGNHNVPVELDITDATAVSVGDAHACARRSGGRISCWGENSRGQVGDGSGVDRPTPVDIGLTAMVGVDAGEDHTCGVRSSGELLCWGDNGDMELGDGSTEDRLAPNVVTALTGALDVSAGSNTTCAITTVGALWCWGRNNRGQVGDGTMIDRGLPVMVASGAQGVSVGQEHVCAEFGGTVRCWGRNGTGEVGDGTSMNRSVPTLVSGFTSIPAVAAGRRHSCAVDTDGGVWCWGENSEGQFGDGSRTSTDAPVPGAVMP